MPRLLLSATDLWSRVDVRGPMECWPWKQSVTSKGYGQFYFDGHRHSAHRVAFELTSGPIPAGLVIDHRCRNRRCCNPAHLEPVTSAENTRRSPIHKHALTHCPQGHLYAGGNLYVRPSDGARVCRTCSRTFDRKRRTNRPQAATDPGYGCPGIGPATPSI